MIGKKKYEMTRGTGTLLKSELNGQSGTTGPTK